MDPHPLLSVVPYRCVCGNAMALTSMQSRDCLRCGRGVPETAYRIGDATIIGEGAVPACSDQSDPLLGQRLRHFRILSRLGKGGMGAVYRAVDESLQRDVALKVLHPSQAQAHAASDVARLVQEARAQARICHPNVVQVYYVDQQEEHPFLALELVRGETLQDRLRRRKLSFAEVVEIAAQTGRALEAAAQFRIVHGDIKPANLLLTAAGEVKLSDFGLARPIAQLSTGSQPIAGTPNYLSPEGCQGFPTNARSDMYSLGVMLFEMTFGRLPYELPVDTVTARLQAHVQSPVMYPAEWPEDVPRCWKEFLDRLLAKLPQDRFDNYSQLLTSLNRLTPSALPRAGKVARGLAWVADLAPAWALLELARGCCPGGETWTEALGGLAGSGLAAVVLLLFAIGQAARRTSLGKSLFHLRTVDEFGQPAPQSASLWRSLLQQAPLWGLIAARVGYDLGCPGLGRSAALFLLGVTMADALAALIRRDGRAVHDLRLRTHVVVDTAQHVEVEIEEARPAPRASERGRGRSQKHDLILRERLLTREAVLRD